MKTAKLVVYFLLISTVISCSYFKEKLIGVKQPKIENFQTLKEFTEPHGFDASDLYAPIDSIAWKKFLKIGMPQVLFFNSQGHRIVIKGCTQTFDDFINDSLDNKEAMNRQRIDSTVNTFSFYQPDIIQLQSMTPPQFEPNYDYTIVITWAKWTGKLMFKQYPKKWYNRIVEKGYRVRPILLTLDYMEHTGMTVEGVEFK